MTEPKKKSSKPHRLQALTMVTTITAAEQRHRMVLNEGEKQPQWRRKESDDFFLAVSGLSAAPCEEPGATRQEAPFSFWDDVLAAAEEGSRTRSVVA